MLCMLDQGKLGNQVLRATFNLKVMHQRNLRRGILLVLLLGKLGSQSIQHNLNLKVMTFLFSLTFLQKFSFILLWPKEAFLDHPVIPLNILVFIWRLLFYIIPVGKTMQRTCITLVSTCSCINNYLRRVFCKAKSHIAWVPK